MRKVLIALFVSLMMPALVLAQDENSKVTVFGAYSYLRSGGNGSNGWNGQATYNLNPYLGITADIGGNYRTIASFSPIPGFSASAKQRLYTFLVGPTLTANLGRTSVFGHALFGAARSSSGAGIALPIIGGFGTGIDSATAFAMAFGGGVDIAMSRHISIRPLQIDYIRTQFNSLDALSTGFITNPGSGGQNSFRYAAGVVFRF